MITTFSDDVTSFGNLLLMHCLHQFSDLKYFSGFKHFSRLEYFLFISQEHNLQLVSAFE